MCSRVTPMHLTGEKEPIYSGNHIYWDEKSEEELKMGLTDAEIKELLNWFVNSSEIYKNWMPKRKAAEDINHEWIQPEVIAKMSEEDLEEHYLNYYNSGTGEKQNLIAIRRDRIIRNENFKKSLLYLLDEELNVKTRIDVLMDTKNDKHIEGMSRALITAFLMDFKPEKYGLWNSKIEDGFKALGWDNLYQKRGDSSGDVYLKVLGLLEKLKTLRSDLDLSFLDVDLFLHVIAAEKEGIDKLNEIKGLKSSDDDTNKIGSFFEYLSEKGYFFEQDLVENFLLSLKVKPFVILTGNSGTGKTKLAQLFAQYSEIKTSNSYPSDTERDTLPQLTDKKTGKKVESKKYAVVPVGANWTENRHIIGFYNIITEEYEKTPALDLIMNACNIKDPNFFILDEMNLSHVERYFSDFLSAMESGESIPLHQNTEIDFPMEIEKLPENLCIIGTVNVDETTYMFSPKVLDRANTIEFLTPSAMDYMNGWRVSNNHNGNLKYLENPLSDLDIRKALILDLKELFMDVQTPEGSFWDVLSTEIFNFQETLKKAGFDFGFRVINEIMRFMYVSWEYEGKPSNWTNWERYFDAQIKQKMLPRIHGSPRTLENTLKTLSERCINYPSSRVKLEEMIDVLYKQRYVSFTN